MQRSRARVASLAGPAGKLPAPSLSRSAIKDDVVDEVLSATAGGLLPAERFVSMNRFEVRDNAGAQFEQRWAKRKSSLLGLDGFRWFSLLRRVPPSGEEVGYQYPDDYSYVSLTQWERKEDFNSWRKGPAFKEAHGGGNILGFVSMVISNFMTAKGPPKPAFWNSVLIEKAARSTPLTSSRSPSNDEELIESDVFVSMNRFSVAEGHEQEFEERWATRDSTLPNLPGFRTFQLLRRDQVPDDDVNYISMAVWDSRDAFDHWRNGEGFQQAHSRRSDQAPLAAVLRHPPRPYFYEGKLVVESEHGA